MSLLARRKLEERHECRQKALSVDWERFDVVLANPPFGGKERKEVQRNFPIRTGETAFLFLQHFIKMLKAGGRGGVVIKNTFLSNNDNASVSLRKLLLESCVTTNLRRLSQELERGRPEHRPENF